VDELLGGVLEDDPSACETLRSTLQGDSPEHPEVEATQQKTTASLEPTQSRGNFLPAKRPRHSMAVPFQTARPRVPQTEEDTAATAQSEETYPRSCSVYVANLPFRTEDVKVSNFFEDRCRPAQVLEVNLLTRPDGRPAGSAIILFDSLDGASKAIALNGKPGLEYRKLIVREDRPRRVQGDAEEAGGTIERTKGKGRKGRGRMGTEEKDDEGASAACSVIVKNLAFDASEANLGALFAHIGEVAKVRIARDSKTGKARGFAVVEFSEASQAEAALQHTGAMVRERPVRIERMAVTAPAAATPRSTVPKSLDFAEQLGISEDEADEAAVEVDETKQGKSQVEDGAMNGPDAKRRRGGDSEAKAVEYPAGAEGLLALAKLACSADSVQSLLESTPVEELTGRLSALGLKAGGTPSQRAERIWALKDVKDLDAVPQAFFAKPSKMKGNTA